MIEPALPDPDPEPRGGASPAAPGPPAPEPVVLEDLTAAVRLPILWRKVEAVLAAARAEWDLPPDLPFLACPLEDRVHEYGRVWRDPSGLLRVFQGMAWWDHDPAWEVRVEAADPAVADLLRAHGWHRIVARRAEARFLEWDRFWHEDTAGLRGLAGATAACTRFLEDERPDQSAAEYLGGALYALHASGSLLALLEAVRTLLHRGGEAGAG